MSFEANVTFMKEIEKRLAVILPAGAAANVLSETADVLSKSGVTDVHPHTFRRTLATNLIRHGMPIQEVAAILGHDKLDTTMQYIVMDRTEVKSAYRKFA